MRSRLALLFALAAIAAVASFVLRYHALESEARSTLERVRSLATRTAGDVMIYRTPDGDLFVVWPLPGEEPEEWMARARRIVEGGQEDPNTKCDDWTTASGAHIIVCTSKAVGETHEEFCNRHERVVAAAQAEFPCPEDGG